MSTLTANRILKRLADRSPPAWLLSEHTLRTFLGYSENTARVTFSRLARKGVFERVAPGLYLNPYCQRPAWALEKLADRLRPDDSYYVSLESALAEHGWLSQQPSRLTLMTTGRSYTFETPLGVIEFVHTDRDPARLRDRMQFLDARKLFVASAELAYEDLKHVNRNLDLIEIPDDEEG